MAETFTIEDIKRLEARPGDMLLVTVPEETEPHEIDSIREAFLQALPGVRIIVKTAQIGVEVVSEAERIQRAVDQAYANPGKTFEAGRQ